MKEPGQVGIEKNFFNNASRPSDKYFFSSYVQPEDANIPCSPAGFLKAYKENVWLRRCLDVRSNNLSSVPIKLIEGKLTDDGAYVEIKEHPILDLLENVNEQTMNKITLLKATSLDCDIFGMAAWLITKSRDSITESRQRPVSRRGRPKNQGLPLEIYRLNPARLRLVPAKQPDKFISHYEYTVTTPGGVQRIVEYNEDEIVLFKVFNPEDEYRGLSLVQTVRKYVSADINALNWNANFFVNASSPGNVIIFPDPLDAPQREYIETVINKRHAGTSKHGSTLVLGGGPRFEGKNATPRDADWSTLSTVNRDSICAVTGVPVFLVSGNDSSRYDTADPQKASFWEETLLPVLAWWAETLNWSLVKMYPDLAEKKAKIIFDTSEIPALKAVTLARYQKITTATGVPFLTTDEGRAIIGKGPVEGGDKILIPIGVIPLDTEDLEFKANAKVFNKDDEQQARHATSEKYEQNDDYGLREHEDDDEDE